MLSVVFEELGLAEQTMLVAFGIAFGALMLGLAIAFGIGGKDLAQRFLEKRMFAPRSKRTKTNCRRSSLARGLLSAIIEQSQLPQPRGHLSR